MLFTRVVHPWSGEMASSVNGSPGVEMGMSGDAIPVPEVEPEVPAEVNIVINSNLGPIL